MTATFHHGGESPRDALFDQVSWFAIRQPGVLRFLENELRADDRDCLAAALDLTSRLFGELSVRRLGDADLAQGLAAVRAGHCQRSLARWLRSELSLLPIVLTAVEEDAVATAVAAAVWAATHATAGDELIAA